MGKELLSTVKQFSRKVFFGSPSTILQGLQVQYSQVGAWPKMDGAGRSWSSAAAISRYEKRARSFDLEGALKTLWVQETVEFLKLIHEDNAKMLDVGCADGLFRWILGSIPHTKGWSYTGIDVSEGFIKLCRRLHPDVPFERASLEYLPFPPKSFDVVLACGVLQYIRNWEACVHELRRVVRKDGYIALTRVPVVKHTDTTIVKQIVGGVDSEEEHHFWLFQRGLLERNLLKKAKLELVHRDYTSEIYRVKGIEESVVANNYLLRAGGV